MKDSIIYVEHILVCIRKIKSNTAGLEEEGFLKSSIVQDAVIRNVEIIGEATNKLDDNLRLKYSEFEWQKISGMRNKSIYG